MKPHILFCSDFPLGYHNPEAELKLGFFAARGYGTTYVEKLGIRNPRPAQLVARLRASTRSSSSNAGVSPKLLLPRRAPVVDAVNRRWVARQLLSHVPDPARTVVWLRFPTPELVPFAERPEWPLVVYEAVDDHATSPGINDRLRRVLESAEARVLARAGLVFAWSEPIAERLRTRHANVVLAPAAVDLDAFARARDTASPRPRVAAYAGALDFRFDAGLVAEVAARLGDWTFRLAGPADPGVAGALADVANVELVGRLPARDVPGFLAAARASHIPYREDAFNDNLFPIKLVECLASGRPTVSTAIRAAREFSDVLAVASGAAAFADAVARASDDPPEASARRVQRAAPYGWARRIDEMEAAISEALP